MSEYTGRSRRPGCRYRRKPEAGSHEQHLAVSLYRAVAEGRPVSVASLAQRCGRDESRVAATLAAWPGVFFDATGSVIGFCAWARRWVPGALTFHPFSRIIRL